MEPPTRSSEAAADALPITIVVATIHGWPEIATNLKTMQLAALRASGELLVADGSGRPPPANLGAEVRWMAVPGASIYQLRAMAYKAARGEVVAITEDHCRVPQDWGERMVEIHRRHPEAAAIGGAVENGATGSLLDWASYYIVQLAVIAPFKRSSPARIAGAGNVAYKRCALALLEDHQGLGALDLLDQQQLRAAGERLLADDTIRVQHDQSLGFRGTTAIHYHAGRTMAGFRRQHMGPREWMRAGGAFVVPWLRLGRILALGSGKEHRSALLISTPWMIWLLHAQAVGQFLGFALGPGDSPSKVQ